jgi:excisionase family DNA binding protein
MFKDLILSYTEDEFKTILRDCIKAELCASALQIPPQLSDEFINENQARDLLDISKVTLKKWRDENKIPYYRMGTRIRYKKHELISCLSKDGKFSGKIKKS